MQTTIQKWGNSNAIRIPKGMLDELGLSDGVKVELVREGDHITIKKAEKKKHISLAERYKIFEKEHGKTDYAPGEVDFGKSEGTEVW